MLPPFQDMMYETLIQEHFAGDNEADIRRYLEAYSNLLGGNLFCGEPGPQVHLLYALVEKLCSSFVYVTKLEGQDVVSLAFIGDTVVRASGGASSAAFFQVTRNEGELAINLVVPPGENLEVEDLENGIGVGDVKRLIWELFAEGSGNRRIMVIRDQYMAMVSAVVNEMAVATLA